MLTIPRFRRQENKILQYPCSVALPLPNRPAALSIERIKAHGERIHRPLCGCSWCNPRTKPTDTPGRFRHRADPGRRRNPLLTFWRTLRPVIALVSSFGPSRYPPHLSGPDAVLRKSYLSLHTARPHVYRDWVKSTLYNGLLPHRPSSRGCAERKGWPMREGISFPTETGCGNS